MNDFLWAGVDGLIVALIALLGYELHAWLTRDEPTISWIVRRWRGDSLWRKLVVFIPITIIACSIQFLGVHFVFNVG